jgi:hypothetical protein
MHRGKSRVKYECASNIDYDGIAIRFSTRDHKGSIVLDLLEEHLDRLIRIIRRVGRS